MSWQDKTYDFKYLRLFAGLAHPEDEKPSIEWLQEIGIVPDGPLNLKGGHLRSGVDGSNIPAWYIAKFAVEFDRDGPSTPVEFCNALSFELEGTPQRKNFTELVNQISGVDK